MDARDLLQCTKYKYENSRYSAENKFTGVNFKFGGYVNSGTKLPHLSGYGDYAALNTYHWIYKGTGLEDGDEFGYDDAIVGYETDGTRFYYDLKGVPVPYTSDNDETPSNYRILGVSPAEPFDPIYVGSAGNIYPHAAMGYYYTGNKGAVFNGATTDWSDGLLTDTANSNNNFPDPIVDRITKNVLNKFLENKFPPEITDWSPYLVYSKKINYDYVNYNVRDTMYSNLQTNDVIQYSITAKNPFASQVRLNYAWKADGIEQTGANSSSFTYVIPNTFAAVKKHTITAYAINEEDTSSISWNIFTQPVVISYGA